MAWLNLEHQLWAKLKHHGLDASNEFILAISGGLDSMALLNAMVSVKPAALLTVAYYHHGDNQDLSQVKFRDDCAGHIQKSISDFPNLKFVMDKSASILKSEAQMRSARHAFLNSLKKTENTPIVTAHHLDDWVETMTLKMIRGAGPDGFTAFKMWDGNLFRPFLETSKADLQKYKDEKQFDHLEDPSNIKNDYLRNWLRNDWFKNLDLKQEGGYQNFSKSLLRLHESIEQNQAFSLKFWMDKSEKGLDRNWYFSLTEKLQLKALSLFLRHHEIYEFTQGQLAEINKRLDKNQKDLTFELISTKWVINASQIMLEF
jgi:tRNA(Ile)-lysidine synthase